MSCNASDPTAPLAAYYSARAHAYVQRWNDVLQPANRELVDRLALSSAQRILDLGSGVGAVLPVIAGRAPSATIVAADRSIGMLALAPDSFPRVILDATRLPFGSGTFDAAVLAFMVQHLPDPAATVAEVGRVLRPGGQIGIAMWGTVRNAEALRMWNDELDRIGAPAAPPFVDPPVRVDSAAAAIDVLTGAGFTEVEVRPIQWSDQPDPDTFAARHVALGPASRRLERLPPDAQREFVQRMRRRLAAQPPGAFRDDSEVFGVVARRGCGP